MTPEQKRSRYSSQQLSPPDFKTVGEIVAKINKEWLLKEIDILPVDDQGRIALKLKIRPVMVSSGEMII